VRQLARGRGARRDEDGAALLERASAPSRPEQIAPGEQRAGVASREREERRAVESRRAPRPRAG